MFLLFLGNINSKNSEGTNELIKQGAEPITNYTDILQNIKFFDKDLHI